MRILMHVMLILSIAINSNACDMCGCAAGSDYIGLLPQFQRSFIGLKYETQVFNTSSYTLEGQAYAGNKMHIQYTQLWGRYNPHKRVQIFFFLPYKFNQQKTGGELIQTNGIGDAQFLINYVLYYTASNSKSNWKHSLQIGTGLKLPTGKYNLVRDGLFIEQALQIGTGSYDIPLNMIYTLRCKNFGLNAEANKRFNGTSKIGYSFGDKFNSSLRFLYWKENCKVTLLPHLGCNVEHAAIDKRNNKEVEFSGGTSMLGTLGCDAYYKQWAFGLQLSKPIYENLSNPYIKGQARVSANLIYLLKSKNSK